MVKICLFVPTVFQKAVHYDFRTRSVTCSSCSRMNTLENLEMQIQVKMDF